MTTPFDLSEAFVDELAELNPLTATDLGLPGRDHLWPDFGANGIEATRQMNVRYLGAFEPHLDHPDPWQRLAATVAHDFLLEAGRRHDAGDHYFDVAHVGSSFDAIRQVFDVMRKDSPEAWEAICTRLETMDDMFSGYRAKLEQGVETGKVAAARQVESVIAQASELGGGHSALMRLVRLGQDSGLVGERIEVAVDAARRANDAFADFLEVSYLPAAPEADGVGEERYRRAADGFLGLEIDPAEVYAWGWEELHRIRMEMVAVGEQIAPGSSIREVATLLETDPDRCAPTHAEFIDFVSQLQHRALAALDETQFDVPDPIKTVSVNIAPPGGPLGAYYLQPSEDLISRPGGVWYSLPAEDGPVPLYQEVSTAYHEGFPGHHLQVGTVMAMSDRLSRFHRALLWYSGFGEGWALYTERLMHELGFFEKPDYVFGMLASHLFRTARVVVDIGCHLGLDIPAGSPLFAGEPWTFERAVDFMTEVGLQPRPYAESEVKRYLGWPGQAISYKVGEREILTLRADLQRRLGPDFSLKEFHGRVLGHGELRLDRLRTLVMDGWE